MESIQQFSTVYREAHHVVVEEIYVLIKSNYAIISIVFYHHMFDFNNLLIISKFTILSYNTLLLRKKEKKLFLKKTEPTECTYNQGLGPDAN